jgi:hypothetical protein
MVAKKKKTKRLIVKNVEIIILPAGRFAELNRMFPLVYGGISG